MAKKTDPILEYLNQEYLFHRLEWVSSSSERPHKKDCWTLGGALVHGKTLLSMGRDVRIRDMSTGDVVWENGDFLEKGLICAKEVENMISKTSLLS